MNLQILFWVTEQAQQPLNSLPSVCYSDSEVAFYLRLTVLTLKEITPFPDLPTSSRGWPALYRAKWWTLPALWVTVLFFIWLHHAAWGILVPWPEIEPRPSVVDSPNCWTSREFPIFKVFQYVETIFGLQAVEEAGWLIWLGNCRVLVVAVELRVQGRSQGGCSCAGIAQAHQALKTVWEAGC